MYPQFPLSFLDTLGGSPIEMAIVLLAILMLFGAKSLPGTLRTLGRWSEQLRRISQDLQRELNDAEEPFHRARMEWEEQTKDFTVSADDVTDTPPSTTGEKDPGFEEHQKNAGPHEV